jgi:hypothetical protein
MEEEKKLENSNGKSNIIRTFVEKNTMRKQETVAQDKTMRRRRERGNRGLIMGQWRRIKTMRRRRERGNRGTARVKRK